MEHKLIQKSSAPAEKTALLDFLRDIFDIRLTQWVKLNQWTDDYTCYTLWNEGVLVANVSAYGMRMRIGGREQRWTQLGGVATRTSWRGRGLSRMLMEKVLQDHAEDPMFLFANRDVLGFYPRFGFYPMQDKIHRLEISLASHPGDMITLSSDAPTVERYLHERCCYSDIIDCMNAAPLHWFHLLAGGNAQLYQIPALDLLFSAERMGTQLMIHEVWAKQPVKFADICSRLDFPGVTAIWFGFNPDWIGLVPETLPYTAPDGSNLFVRGSQDLPPNGMIPWLVRT